MLGSRIVVCEGNDGELFENSREQRLVFIRVKKFYMPMGRFTRKIVSL